MATTIVKTDRDVDFYVVWESIVDAPVCFGPREYVQGYLIRQSAGAGADERSDRADLAGTSAKWPTEDDPDLGWGDAGTIYEQRGWLRRGRMRALCERLAVDESADVTDLLEPFEDEAEVRPA